MRLFTSVLLTSALSIAVAAAAGVGACSSSASDDLPAGDVAHYSIGSVCAGAIYDELETGAGYEICVDSAWEYSATIPAGYSPYGRQDAGVTIAVGSPPSGWVGPTGAYAIGTTCSGDVYFDWGAGDYVVCDEDLWVYSSVIPSGYTLDTDAPSYTGNGVGDDAGDDSGTTIITGAPPAGWVGPTGAYALGATCTGDVYFPWDGGYVLCNDGVWVYSTAIPSGYVIDADAPTDSGDDAGDDGGTGSDAGFDSGDDAGDAATSG
jgi:hypothetical protein